jgi:alcohol dehydrogenase (cytochrome c)
MGFVLAVALIPGFRWRVQVVGLKATGALPDISWRELLQVRLRGNPLNLKGLIADHNPYRVIWNPYAAPADVVLGQQIFQAHCATCHGADGVGGRSGPALQHRQMQHGNSDWAMLQTISHGIPNTAMPASTLPGSDRWRLVAYVKSLAQGAESNLENGVGPQMNGLRPVRYEDIVDAENPPDQWLTYSGSYDGHRFSRNDQITPSNVSHLRLLWMRQYTTSERLIETSPLVLGGFMFVTVPPNRVEALDAKTGKLIWQYDRELPTHMPLCCGYVNRGLAVLGSTLFFGTLDAHLVALDIKTGKVLWDVAIADYKVGYSITGAPLVLKNLVITGVAGGEYGIRGFIDARDPKTGQEVWKFDTIPQPGQPGSQSWQSSAWKTGGGPTWLTGTYDAASNTLYWPVGNPSPNYSGDTRAGDNLYTNSVVALDADHGTLRWYFQFTPHDLHDWDSTEIPVLIDQTVPTKPEHLLVQANRNGFYYVLDRDSGTFRSAQPFTKQTWAQEIDRDGRPVVNPAAIPNVKGAAVYPAMEGATNWISPSYNPVTGFLYVPGWNWGGIFYSANSKYHPGENFTAGYFDLFVNPDPGEAVVRALDAVTGKVQWEYRMAYPAHADYDSLRVGGVLSTKGGIVFGSAAHYFLALDAKTGQELWRLDTGGLIMAAPITFLQDGRQMVTIAAGHDLLTFGL